MFKPFPSPHVLIPPKSIPGQSSGTMRRDIPLEVQEVLPCLENLAYLSILFDCKEGRPLTYPRTPEDVKKSLVDIAISLCRHEKHSGIWRRQVSLSPLTKIS